MTASNPSTLPLVPRPRCPTRRARHRLRFERPQPVSRFDEPARRALAATLYPIFRASYGELPLETVRDEIIFRAGGYLTLLRDAEGALIGFGTARVHELTVDGRTHGVFEGGVYCRPGVKGGEAFGLFALRVILAERLRHPLRSLHLVAEMLSPVSYRLAHRIFATTYPDPEKPTPPALAAVLEAEIESRGLLRPTEHPFVARYPDPALPVRIEDIRRSESLRGDPAIDAYLRWNPHYAQGHLLCTITPLGWRDLVAAALRQIVGRRIRCRPRPQLAASPVSSPETTR